jgi:hypothetical protein
MFEGENMALARPNRQSQLVSPRPVARESGYPPERADRLLDDCTTVEHTGIDEGEVRPSNDVENQVTSDPEGPSTRGPAVRVPHRPFSPGTFERSTPKCRRSKPSCSPGGPYEG